MDRFPALRLILRLGRIGPSIIALVATALTVVHAWSHLGWLSVLLAPFMLGLIYFLMKSYVEIVQIITEMVH